MSQIHLKSQRHLKYEDRVNLGSYYTPPKIVDIAWEEIAPHVDGQTTIIDNACGYGDFLRNHGQSVTIGCDIDETAINVARKKNNDARFFRTNSLHDIARAKFGISQQSKLIVVGNPPYNDKTSRIRQRIKRVDFDIDPDIASRDLGISFLRSYNKLEADLICILHPLSYLIKPANFRLLKDFASNYRLIDGLLISSWEFPESSKLTPFPIVLALYLRDTRGLKYSFIRSFRFSILGGGGFSLDDFEYITSYINKYPSRNKRLTSDSSLFSDNDFLRSNDELFFWTMRDINALKRNRTFVKNYNNHTIIIDKKKLDYYVYVDVFKRNLHRLPFYFGNCDVPIDNNLFKQYRYYFISDAIRHHPFLKKHFQINPIERAEVESKVDTYFRLLLGEYHV